MPLADILHDLVLNNACRSNHHRIAIMALPLLDAEGADKWRALFLHHHEAYLAGSKAPDEVFKDFKNHVLHVRDNYWGGAIEAAEAWRTRTLRALQDQDWRLAVYSAGVLSHYLADPVQPFHTGQTEEENVIHRAVEWSFSKSYPTLRRILDTELGGFPEIAMPEGETWLADMVRAGAERANAQYETVIDHYDFKIGKKDPPAGLDDVLRRAIADLLGYATALHARVLSRIMAESGAEAPDVNLTLDTFFAGIKAPMQRVFGLIEDGAERKLVGAMYAEYCKTGKVRETLPEDDRKVRTLYAKEVLNTPLSTLDCAWPREIGLAHGAKRDAAKSASKAKPRLAPEDDVVDAPSIGPKTAARLQAVDIRTVAELLAADPEATAKALDVSHINARAVSEWQDQARLACGAAGLTGTGAQLLVACGVRSVEALAQADPAGLAQSVGAYCASPAGVRLLRGSSGPSLGAIGQWIEAAQSAGAKQAA